MSAANRRYDQSALLLAVAQLLIAIYVYLSLLRELLRDLLHP